MTTYVTPYGSSSVGIQTLVDPGYVYGQTGTQNGIVYWTSNTGGLGSVTPVNKAVLTTDVSGNPQLTALNSNGQLIIGSTGGSPAAAALTAGTGVSITNGANSITISAGGIIGWVEETTTARTLTVNQGVIANNASLVVLTLPTTAAVGSVIRIVGKGAGLWKLAQVASSVIHYGSQTTTVGTGGYLLANNQYDAIEIVCTVANTTWTEISGSGSLTVV